jgi:hypothetical protein
MSFISSNLTNRELILLIENNPEALNEEAVRGLVSTRFIEAEATTRTALHTLAEMDRLGIKVDAAFELLSILEHHGLLDPAELQTHFINH